LLARAVDWIVPLDVMQMCTAVVASRP
jgi:hypothetical protein